MSMLPKLEELERAVARAVDQLAALRREESSRSSETGEALNKLTEENRRLREERKELRRKVRRIIREIDKVKW